LRDAFVGRQEELTFLTTLLDSARAGTPWVVFVEGAPGMGKTALVSRLLRTAEGFRLLRAAGEEFEQGLPYGVVDQLRSDAGAEARGEPAADELAVGAELFALLDRAQQAGPVVLVVDDAQWADDPSLRVLAFALRRLRAHRVLAVLVTRDRVAERLPESLHRLMVSAIGARVTVPGLSAAELAALAVSVGAGPLPGRAADRLREHTGGSPLHARALFDELPPPCRWDPAQPLPAPRSFALLVLARLARCSAETERLVVATAVLGTPAPVDLLARLAEVPEPLAALDEAVGAGLLAELPGPTGRRVGFCHPLLQAAVYGDLGPARRSDLHRRAATLLPGAAALRHRVAAAALPDPRLATEIAARAHAEAGTDLSAAADKLAAAARLSPAGPDRERHLLDAAEYLTLCGRTAEAAALVPTLRECAPGPRRELVLGGLALATGSTAEAVSQLTEAWSACDAGAEPYLAARLAVQLSWAVRRAGDATAAAYWAGRAAAADPTAATRLHTTDALLLAMGGRADQPLPDAGPVGRGMVRLWRGATTEARDDLAAAVKRYARPGTGPMQYALTALAGLAEAEYRLGGWDAAVCHAEAGIALATESGYRGFLTQLHALAVLPHASRGDWAPAEAHLEASTAAAGDPTGIAWAATAAAVLAASRGDPAAVLVAARPVLDLPPCDTIPWLEPYLEALIDTGRSTEAAAHDLPARLSAKLRTAQGDLAAAEKAYAAALDRPCRDPFQRARLELEYGALLRRQGRRARAAALLRTARSRLTDLGAAPYLDRCDRELRTCGLGHRPDPAGPLTTQERAVADLVAAGRTNREAARELVVSVKTIEFHLGNVFTKLGVRSRSQLTLELLRTESA